MSDLQADVVIVGNGLFGSAATRHLAERGYGVIGIGAPAMGPDRRDRPESDWPAHRVYSSHNDAARLTRLQDRDTRWAPITKRAVGRYRSLEQRSGIGFFDDVGCLIASRTGGDGMNPDPIAAMDATGVEYDLYVAGDDGWKAEWPALDLPATHRVAFEPAPAGYIRPKRMIAAQNALAERAGASMVADTVVEVVREPARFRLVVAGGAEVSADRVLVAAGAFTNFNGLLREPAAVTLKSEVIVLGEVTASDAASLQRYPTVKHLIDPADIEGIYMVPPVEYEDGRWYVKLGANTRLDRWMTELGELQRWFNTDTDPHYLPIYEPALRALWPTTDFVSIGTQPCVITYTDNRYPLIEQTEPGLYVATAGNGGGAKGADAWGELAADLIAGA